MKFIRKILAVCMALLILVSSTGFAMSLHRCGGELQDFAFFAKAETCEAHVKELPSCHHETAAEAIEEKDSCCEDQDLVKEAQELNTRTSTFSDLPTDLQFLAVVIPFLAALVPEYPKPVLLYTDYNPPAVKRDIPVLVQSFLI